MDVGVGVAPAVGMEVGADVEVGLGVEVGTYENTLSGFVTG
jgi:hypothetical protein